MEENTVIKSFAKRSARMKKLEVKNPVPAAVELALFDLQQTCPDEHEHLNHAQIEPAILEIITRFYRRLIGFSSALSRRDYDVPFINVCREMMQVRDHAGCRLTFEQTQVMLNSFIKSMIQVDEKLHRQLPCYHVPLNHIVLKALAEHGCTDAIRTSAKICLSRSGMRFDDKEYLELQDALRKHYETPLLFDFETWSQWKDGLIYLEEKAGFQTFGSPTTQREITIKNRDFVMVVREYGEIKIIRKQINDDNYKSLLTMMRKYKPILNPDPAPKYFDYCPTLFNYDFEGKSNHKDADGLFKSEDKNLVNEANAAYQRIIENICHQ